MGRNQDGKSSSVSRTEQLPQLQLQLLNTADRTSALQLPNARSEPASVSSSPSFLVLVSVENSCGFSLQVQTCRLIKRNHLIWYLNAYMQTETDSHTHTSAANFSIFSPPRPARFPFLALTANLIVVFKYKDRIHIICHYNHSFQPVERK